MSSTFALAHSIAAFAAIVVVMMTHKLTGSLFRRQDKNGNKSPSVVLAATGVHASLKKLTGGVVCRLWIQYPKLLRRFPIRCVKGFCKIGYVAISAFPGYFMNF